MTDKPPIIMNPQPHPLWCAHTDHTGEPWGGRVLGWLTPQGPEHARALVARVDPDGSTVATYQVPVGFRELWFGDSQTEAFEAARRAAAGKAADTQAALLDAAMHTVWLEGRWEWVTKKMTTEEREAAAAAVERHHDRLGDSEPLNPSSVRWWR